MVRSRQECLEFAALSAMTVSVVGLQYGFDASGRVVLHSL